MPITTMRRPYKKYRSGYNKRYKKYKKYYKKQAKPTMNIVKHSINNGMPESMITKFRYSVTKTIDPTLGSSASKTFRANSLHDPDVEVGGTYPMGYRQLLDYYNAYMVIGSKITVKFCSTDNTNKTPTVMGILVADQTSLPTTAANMLLENKNNKTKIQVAQQQSYTGGPTTVHNNWSMKKWFGIKNPLDNTYGYGAQAGSNATHEAYYIVYEGDLTGGVDLSQTYMVVTIDYIAYLYEPKSMVD